MIFVHILVLAVLSVDEDLALWLSFCFCHSFIHLFVRFWGCQTTILRDLHVVMSLFYCLKSSFLFSCSVTPLTICTTVTFYIVLHYSNNSCGEGMHLQVLCTWSFDHAIIFIIYLLLCASCCIIELRSHLCYIFIPSK